MRPDPVVAALLGLICAVIVALVGSIYLGIHW